MRLVVPFVLTVALFVGLGCDTTSERPHADNAIDPDTVDFDAVTMLSYSAYVQPLLAARCVFCATDDARPVDDADVTWQRLFYGDDGWGRYIVPFDADGSLLVRLAERLDPTVSIDFPNVSGLQPDEVRYLRRWIADGARDDDGTAPYTEVLNRAYVCNQDANRVSIVDVDRQQIIRTVDFGRLAFGGNAAPHHLAVEPDGSAWYVTLINAGTVVKLTTNLDALHDPARAVLGQTRYFFKPGMLALDPGSDWLYLSHSVSDNTSNTLGAIDRRTMDLTEIVLPVNGPHAIAVAPDGRHIYTASLVENTVLSLDVTDPTNADIASLLPISGPTLALLHFDLSPDGATAAITSQFTDEVFLIDTSDPTNLAVAARIPVGDTPWYPVFSPDGRRLYVPNHYDDTISVLDVATRTEVKRITNADAANARYGGPHQPDLEQVLAHPHDGAFSTDGRYFFVTNANMVHAGGDHTSHTLYAPEYPLVDDDGEPIPSDDVANVAVIDTQTLQVVKVIETGAFATGIYLFNGSAPNRLYAHP